MERWIVRGTALAALCIAALCVAALAAGPARAVLTFTDAGDFAAAAGTGLIVLDFDEIVVDENGYAAFSNGKKFHIATFESLSLPADIELFAGGSSTGLFGTFLVGFRDAMRGNDIRPGGVGALGEPADNDDFRIEFAPPLRAVGILIRNNTAEDGEALRVLSGGDLLESIPLPGGGANADRFRGFVLEAGEDWISALEVFEGEGGGAINGDDIAFDDISYVPEHTAALPALSRPGRLLFGMLLFGSGAFALARRHLRGRAAA